MAKKATDKRGKNPNPKIPIENIYIPDEVKNSAASTADQIDTLNLALGNYLDKAPLNTIIDSQRPSDGGTGTITVNVCRWHYYDDDPDYDPEFILEWGYIIVDMIQGWAGEADFYDSLKSFDTYAEAYQYTCWLLENAYNGHFLM